LCETGAGLWQDHLVDLTLMLFEGRQMGVAEDRQSVGSQRQALSNGIDAGRHGLVRQAVDQVQVDAADPCLAQSLHGGGGLFEALDPIDRALDHWVEALHPQARAGDAGRSQRRRHLAGERSRIDLDGDFRVRRDRESGAKQVDQGEEYGRWQDGRRAAAEVDVVDGEAAAEAARHEIHLPAQRLYVVEDRAVAPRDRRVASAVPAHRSAEGHVEVKGSADPFGQIGEPASVVHAPDLGPEMRRRRVARIAGHALIGVARQERGRHWWRLGLTLGPSTAARPF
jgi:hypothetical protein